MTYREEQIHRIYEIYTAPLRTYIDLNFSVISQDCEDTVHDILEKIVKHFGRYDSRYALSTWIYRIARNHCIDIIRKQKQLITSDSEALKNLISPAGNPYELMETDTDRQRIRYLLSQLPVREREVLFLRYFEEMSYRDIARVMSTPMGTVKYLIHKAKEWIKENWEVAS
jgi:RNA polymerase sigma-70 factor (ECF subfamily)